MCLHSAQQHEHALPRLLEIYWKLMKKGHLFTQDTLDGTNGVCSIKVSLYMKLGFVKCLDKQGIILVSFKRVFHGIISINAYVFAHLQGI